MKKQFLKRYQREYRGSKSRSEAASDPFKLFKSWYKAAVKAKLREPNAMTLATADAKGKPSTRMVLLKSFNKDGFVFFTNYRSRKGRNISQNPNVALCFYWDKLERQVRIEGKIALIDSAESDLYFYSRPLGAQFAAAISQQSKECTSLEILERKLAFIISRQKSVTRPSHWGGYKVIPSYFEFWEGRPNRLHERIAFKRSTNRWRRFYLQP